MCVCSDSFENCENYISSENSEPSEPREKANNEILSLMKSLNQEIISMFSSDT